MKKAIKIFVVVLAVLIVLGFIGWKILLDYSSVPNKSDLKFTVNMLRDTAVKAGPLPVRINMLRIGSAESPIGMAVAGKRDKSIFDLVSYQLVYDRDLPGGGKTVIIDAALDKSQLKKMQGTVRFDDANYKMLQQGMRNATAILATHEHFDHVGGIALSPYFQEIMGKIILTEEQTASPLIIDAGFTGEALTKLRKIKYEGVYSPLPGIVLVKTPGHTPGGQMVYVRLQNGGEYLIAGDIAWNMENITSLKQRPVLVSLLLRENRDQVGNQLRWLHDEIYQAHNEIRLMVYHDWARHDDYIKKGFLGSAFELK